MENFEWENKIAITRVSQKNQILPTYGTKAHLTLT
jgi:hypothetical protein